VLSIVIPAELVPTKALVDAHIVNYLSFSGIGIALSINSKFVMPAKAGIQNGRTPPFQRMDSRFRGNDETMRGKMCASASAKAGVHSSWIPAFAGMTIGAANSLERQPL